MTASRRRALVIFAGMAAAAAGGMVAAPSPFASQKDDFDLEVAIPAQFGPWRTDPLAAAFVRPTDELTTKLYQDLLERTYIDGLGRRVMLSIAHGRQQASGLEVHLPEVCYRFAGFAVSGRRVADIAFPDGDAQVTRLFAVLPLRPEAVTYWIVLGDERIADANTFRLRRLASAVRLETKEGLLVRVSSLDLDADRAFDLQAQFIDDLLRSLSPRNRLRITGTPLSVATLKARPEHV